MALYLNGVKVTAPTAYGAFAALSEQANTTITDAGTYYPILGTFTNSPVVGFQGVADPAIQYTAAPTRYFEIDWHATLSADDGLRTVHCGVNKNGTFVDSSRMGAYLKTADEPGSFSGTCVVQLEKNDKIQLVVTSSADGDVITFYHFTTTIREFF